MKRVILILLLINLSLFSDEIDKIISKINEKRDSSLSKTQLIKIESPMPKITIIDKNSTKDKNKTIVIANKKEETFTLSAIINNSALINDKWVKLGEKINGYKLVDIMDDSVYLQNNKKSKLIFFKKKSDKIKISIGG